MNLENKIEAQRKRMEQEKNKLDMLMKTVILNFIKMKKVIFTKLIHIVVI